MPSQANTLVLRLERARQRAAERIADTLATKFPAVTPIVLNGLFFPTAGKILGAGLLLTWFLNELTPSALLEAPKDVHRAFALGADATSTNSPSPRKSKRFSNWRTRCFPSRNSRKSFGRDCGRKSASSTRRTRAWINFAAAGFSPVNSSGPPRMARNSGQC
jgi:hypothetical protein